MLKDLHRLPCMSTSYCVEPPKLGITSTVTSSGDPVDAWKIDQAQYKCAKPGIINYCFCFFQIYLCSDNYFLMPEVDFNTSFSVACEKEIIFGKKLPYWKIPGTDYPTITEVVCVTALECLERADLGDNMADDYDDTNYMIDDTFEYYCDLGGKRGQI